jgi:hypothetical protein
MKVAQVKRKTPAAMVFLVLCAICCLEDVKTGKNMTVNEKTPVRNI